MSYVVSQYLCEQEGSIRYSMSGFWLPKGSLAVWRAFCRWYGHDKLALWDAYLKRAVDAKIQQVFPVTDGGPPPIESPLEADAPSSVSFVEPFSPTFYMDENWGKNVRYCIRCHRLKETRYVDVAGGFLCYDCYPDERKDRGGEDKNGVFKRILVPGWRIPEIPN